MSMSNDSVEDGVTTRLRLQIDDYIVLATDGVTKLMDVASEASAYEVIGIDEGQFFPDVVPFCEMMANKGAFPLPRRCARRCRCALPLTSCT